MGLYDINDVIILGGEGGEAIPKDGTGVQPEPDFPAGNQKESKIWFRFNRNRNAFLRFRFPFNWNRNAF